MKIKTSILMTALFAMSAVVFGQQKPVSSPTPVPNQPADVKSLEIKPAKAASSPNAAKLPTAQEILAKYVQALGGKAANEKIKSRYAKGTVELAPLGVKGTFETYTAAPSKSLSRTTLEGLGEIVEGFNGTTAWSINPLQGNRDKAGDELAQAKLIYDFDRETKLEKLYPKMEVKGIEKVGASDAYVVLATPAGNLPPETFYFDTKSGLLVRQDATLVAPEGNQAVKVFFEDYRDVDGVKVFFKSRTILPQFEILTVNTEVKNNVTVEDAKFVKPKA